ncbi:nuclear transport factor 2 family protein [soil metagenome]
MSTSDEPSGRTAAARTLIETYFERAIDADRESYVALFADDVVVEDEGLERHGVAAVREWRAEVPPVTYALRAVVPESDTWVATASVAGDFPGSPVDLTFRFRFDREGKIGELRIRS